MRDECKACGLSVSASDPYLSPVRIHTGEAGSKRILIVTGFPHIQNDGAAVHFNKRQAAVLKSALRKAKLLDNTIIYAAAVRCEVPKKVRAIHMKSCAPLLKKEIERRSPDLIICLGNEALKETIGQTGVMKKRGIVFDYPDDKSIKVIAALSPGFVLRDVDQRKRFDADLLFCAKHLAGKKSTFADIPVNMAPSVKDLMHFYARALKNKDAGHVAFDCETNTLRMYAFPGFRVFCTAISDGHETLVIRGDEGGENGKRVPMSRAMGIVKMILEDKRIRKVAHNGKYDCHVVRCRWLIRVSNFYSDTMQLHAQVHPITGGHGLKEIVKEEFGMGGYDQEVADIVGDPPKAEKFALVPYPILAKYCGYDAKLCHALEKKARMQLARIENVIADSHDDAVDLFGPKQLPLSTIYDKIMMPVIRVLEEVERRGVYVRQPYLDTLDAELGTLLEEQEKIIEAIPAVQYYNRTRQHDVLSEFKQKRASGSRVRSKTLTSNLIKATFRPGSPLCIADVLHKPVRFGGLGVSVTAMTDSGERPKLDADTMNDYAANATTGSVTSTFCIALVEWSRLRKLRSTFVEGLRVHISKESRVHSTFWLSRARTGRSSSSDPNQQNIPKKKPFRMIYGASPGQALIEADYSQIELRSLAALSQCSAMTEVFRLGRDLHTETAMEIAGVSDASAVTATQRQQAKPVNFGVAYGMSAYGLRQDLHSTYKVDVTLDEAQAFIDAFFRRFPGVADWHRRVREFVIEYGYVFTAIGTWRRLGNAQIKAQTKDEFRLVEEALRQAINTPVQGTASWMTLISLARLNKVFHKARLLDARIISTVHDSILVECPPNQVVEVCHVMNDTMTTYPLRYVDMKGVPVVVDFKTGPNWGEMVEVKL